MFATWLDRRGLMKLGADWLSDDRWMSTPLSHARILRIKKVHIPKSKITKFARRIRSQHQGPHQKRRSAVSSPFHEALPRKTSHQNGKFGRELLCGFEGAGVWNVLNPSRSMRFTSPWWLTFSSVMNLGRFNNNAIFSDSQLFDKKLFAASRNTIGPLRNGATLSSKMFWTRNIVGRKTSSQRVLALLSLLPKQCY